MFVTGINESLLDNDAYPVFIILSKGKSLFSKGINLFTNSEFTHCSITLDPNLNYFFSYRPNKGFTKETRFSLSDGKGILVSVFFVNKEQYSKIKYQLNLYEKNIKNTGYDFAKLFQKIFNMGKDKNPWKQVCSSFVYSILRNSDIEIAPESIVCVSPGDMDRAITKNKKFIYHIYDGPAMDLDTDYIKIQLDKLKNKKSTKLFDQSKILTESMNPDIVDKSNYDNFTLFDFFHIYTTDRTLRDDPKFLTKMKWVKERIDEICEMAGWTAFPYELTLCASFEDLDEFYNHEAPKWVTGFTYGDKVYMKAPHIYPGELYYNIVLHECIHVQIYLNEKLKGKSISREDEEGMAVFFSTPLNKWLQELNHGPNWYYYESAIRVQDDFMRNGMKYVIKKRFKERNDKK